MSDGRTGKGRTDLPPEVAQLLARPPGPERDAAWRTVVDRYSRLILSTVRALSSDYDEAMDQYAFVLEGLCRDDHQRLETFARSQAGRFEAWLVVVTRRLCIDYQRGRYGRVRRRSGTADLGSSQEGMRVVERRRLVDLVTEELDLARTADPTGSDPEAEVRRIQLRRARQEALDSLSPRERLLLRLRFEDGRSAREIAEAMGFASPFHVYRRLKKVYEELRGQLQQRGVSDPRP